MRASTTTWLGVAMRGRGVEHSQEAAIWTTHTVDVFEVLNRMARLFVSYSHRDDALRAELENHLALLERQGVIESWYDRDINAGDEFDLRIHEELERADIILLLVSSNFLASDYCFEIEMTRALERHDAGSARVIPVILHPCEWQHAPFSRLVAVPVDGRPISTFANRHEAFLQVAESVRRVASSHGPPESGSEVETRRPDRRNTANVVASQRSARASTRIRRTFNDRERDQFIEKAFERIATYFEQGIADIERDNPDVETRFTRRDTSTFIATVYVGGRVAAECKIWRGERGGLVSGIAYSEEPASTNSYNEQFTLEDDGYELRLKLLGLSAVGETPGPMNEDEAAEYYWNLLLRRLR